MIRHSTIDLDGLCSETLPPARRDGPARLLFISSGLLGTSNHMRAFEAYCRDRDDVDSVHIRLS
ncbi:MAG: hypothetical protein AAFX05_05840, partial [Planctomycetota bacterium]